MVSGLIDTYPDTFAVLSIHVGNDGYDTAWGATRDAFYNITGIPSFVYDGLQDAWPIGTYQSKFVARQAQPTDVTIDLTGTPISGQTYDITANVCVEATGTGKSMRVHIVQVLDHYPTSPTYSRNCVMQGASYQNITLAPGECEAVARTFTFDATSWANQDDMKMIAFAQEPGSSGVAYDQEVYQAAQMGWPFITDCNGNTLRDECDVNCLAAGCDVPGCGLSDDYDQDGVPDECNDDCNTNGIPDACDLSCGTGDCISHPVGCGASADCQPDGTPDDCQLDGNDCQPNSVPDECDLAAGSSDCQPDSIPDECQIDGNDCQPNSVPDECDLAASSLDCQPDGMPDECQIDGNDCNSNTIPDDCDVAPSPSSLLFDLSTDPGWSTQGQWAYGDPTGGGSHAGDPDTGYTGANVFGYNLAGDYPSFLSTTYYLTTTAIDCHELEATELRFWRWLGVEFSQADQATIDVSNNGIDWTQIWINPSTQNLDDGQWVPVSYDISAYADGQDTVFLRWGMGPTDSGVTYPGWNIDDVEIWGLAPVSKDCNANGLPDECDATGLAPGDYDDDSDVDLDDFVELLDCLAGPGRVPQPASSECLDPCLGAFDIDKDGDVDLDDIAGFQAAFTAG